jgi:hypothetical protein
MTHGVRCMLYVACCSMVCTLHVLRCILHVVCCMLRAGAAYAAACIAGTFREKLGDSASYRGAAYGREEREGKERANGVHVQAWWTKLRATAATYCLAASPYAHSHLRPFPLTPIPTNAYSHLHLFPLSILGPPLGVGFPHATTNVHHQRCVLISTCYEQHPRNHGLGTDTAILPPWHASALCRRLLHSCVCLCGRCRPYSSGFAVERSQRRRSPRASSSPAPRASARTRAPRDVSCNAHRSD